MRKRVSAVLLLVVLSLPLSASVLQRDDPSSPIDRIVRIISRLNRYFHAFDDPIIPKP